MTNEKSSRLSRGLSMIGSLLTGSRRGPSGGRVRKLKRLQRRIGMRFTDVSLLEQALTHRSYSHVTSQTRNASNERMEFLGDSVLGLAVSQFLYLKFPDRSEGALSKMKSLLVSRKVLSTVSRDVGIGEYLLLSGEESDMGGRDRTSILADSFEGVIGAIYLDQGYRAANKFVQRFLLENIREILKDEEHTNYKSLLQEYVQSKRLSHPIYRVRKEVGPEHEKEFAVEVVVRGEVWGNGRGKSKKEAEQYAARVALERRQSKDRMRTGATTGRTQRSETRRRGREGRPSDTRRGAPRKDERTRDSRTSTTPAAEDRGPHGIAASREKLRAQRKLEAEKGSKDSPPAREGRAGRTRTGARGAKGEATPASPARSRGTSRRTNLRRGPRTGGRSRGGKIETDPDRNGSVSQPREEASPQELNEPSAAWLGNSPPENSEPEPKGAEASGSGSPAEGEALNATTDSNKEREAKASGPRPRESEEPEESAKERGFARRKRRSVRGMRRR